MDGTSCLGWNPDGRDPASVSADDILAHPRSGWRGRCMFANCSKCTRNQPAENRLLIDGGTATIFMSVIIMDAGHRRGPRNMADHANCSRADGDPRHREAGRRTHDIVRRLVDTGYISAYRAPDDRRVTLLAPSDKMLTHDRRALRVYYHPLHVLFPDPGYPEPVNHDPSSTGSHATYAPRSWRMRSSSSSPIRDRLLLPGRPGT